MFDPSSIELQISSNPCAHQPSRPKSAQRPQALRDATGCVVHVLGERGAALAAVLVRDGVPEMAVRGHSGSQAPPLMPSSVIIVDMG